MSTDTLSKSQNKIDVPKLYKVLLLNDDYTPMDFVVYILRRYFRKTAAEAETIMFEGHSKGAAIAGIYSFEIAETKVSQTHSAARQEGHPLRCVVEPE